MCILKILTDLCLIKQNIKAKKYFWKSCLQCFSSESVLNEHKEGCLMINGKQNVKLEKGFIKFKNYSRQRPVPFKIYADFECISKDIDIGISNDGISYTKDIKIMFLVVLLINFCVLMINTVKNRFV